MSEEPEEYALEDEQRTLPQSALDFYLLTTDTVYGTAQVPKQFRKLFEKKEQVFDTEGRPVLGEDGQPVFLMRNLHAATAMFTRDLRLGNLKEEEMSTVRHYTDLAGDLLQEGLMESSAICMVRFATMIETSQSLKGFLRKEVGTVRHESNVTRQEAPKRKDVLSLNRE